MQRHPSKRKRARRKRGGAAYVLLSIVLVSAAVGLALSLFFKINRIEVTGSTVYSDGDIIAASGIAEGDNLFFLDKSAALRGIFDGFPYVAEARLVRSLPGTLIIALTERESLGLVAHNGGYWLIDGTGRLLERASSRSASEKPLVRGVTLLSPSAGDGAAVPMEERERWQALLLILNGLLRCELLPRTTEVDVSNSYEMRLHCDEGRFEVLLGDAVDIDLKLSFLLAAMKEMPASGQWIVDVSRAAVQKKASYYPANSNPAPAQEEPDGTPESEEQPE